MRIISLFRKTWIENIRDWKILTIVRAAHVFLRWRVNTKPLPGCGHQS